MSETSNTLSAETPLHGSHRRLGDVLENLEKIETIRDDGLIKGADPTIAALTGRSMCASPTPR